MRLLVTRPQEDGERTAAALRARGHTVTLAPLVRIEPVDAEFGPGPFAAVLTTSANAARAVVGHPRIAEVRSAPLYTVGAHSAQAARAVGFATVHSADGDAADLVAMVAREQAQTRAPLLYLGGRDRSVDLAEQLAPYGLTVRTAVVYHAATAKRLPSAVEQAIAAGTLDGVLHYSRRSAAAFVRCAGAARLIASALGLTHFCLSAHVAALLAAAEAGDVRVAERPAEEALLDLVGRA